MLRLDEAEAKAGIEGGTPRTIEGPLYVAGAPESDRACAPRRWHRSRPDAGDARPRAGEDGKPLANALVEVWHANHLGNYSYFDRSQPAFNLRRSIRTDADGKYSFRSVVPVGYSVPPQARRNYCSINWAVMDIVRRISTSSCRRRVIAS